MATQIAIPSVSAFLSFWASYDLLGDRLDRGRSLGQSHRILHD